MPTIKNSMMNTTTPNIKEPIVSIVVPVYNTANYLRECLDSIITQSLKEIEIICVNDGSSDNSREILEEYRQKDSRVVVVTQKNQGVSIARNAGVSIALGKYIHFVDSDDWIDPNMCAQTCEIAEKYNADVTRFYNARTLRRIRRRFPKSRTLLIGGLRQCYDRPKLDDRRLFVYMFGYTPCWSCMYRREFWLANKLQFPPGIKMSEDTYVNYIASAVGERIAFFEADLYHWRQRPGSASHPTSKTTLGSYVDTFITYQKTRDFYALSENTEPLCEPLAEVFAYMQRNIQTPLSKSERAIWRKLIDDLLDDRLRMTFYKRDALPAQIRNFWLGLYGRNAVERTFGSAYASFFINLRRLETFGKKYVIKSFLKKNDP